MKLQELTTDELMNIEGGKEGSGHFIYDALFAALRTIRNAKDLADSLKKNPSHGNAMIYK